MRKFEEITEFEMLLIDGGGGSNWFYDTGKAVGSLLEGIVDSFTSTSSTSTSTSTSTMHTSSSGRSHGGGSKDFTVIVSI